MTLRAWLRAHREARNQQAFAQLLLAGPLFPRGDWLDRVHEYDGKPYDVAPWHPLWPGPADDGATLEAVHRYMAATGADLVAFSGAHGPTPRGPR